MVLPALAGCKGVPGDVERRHCLDASEHVARKQVLLRTELIIEAKGDLQLVLVHRRAELNKSAGIGGLREVGCDLDCGGAHRERPAKVAEHGRRSRDSLSSGASGSDVLRKITA